MRDIIGNFFLVCLLSVVPMVGGCQAKEEMVPVSLSGLGHYKDDLSVLGFSVNNEASNKIGGITCCVTLPKHWKPGLTVKVSWSYTHGPSSTEETVVPPPQTKVVEVQKYTPERMGRLQIHFYDGNKVKAVSTDYDIGSPFYPLPKEDWHPYDVNQNVIWNYKNIPQIREELIPEDLEWGKQWGFSLEDKEQKP
jgi:hypothetical protein